jgi:hypothetical protein
MKATYIKPNTETILIAQQLMTGGSVENKTYDPSDPSIPQTNDDSGNLSRHKNVWDDEEEDLDKGYGKW